MVFNCAKFDWCILFCKYKKKIMYYSSTRGNDQDIGFIQAMLNGLAKDGGLFVPKNIKNLHILNLLKFQN